MRASASLEGFKLPWNRVALTANPNLCWEWLGGKLNNGYGNYCNRLVHRLAYHERVGPIPEGLEVQHTCNNRVCCNPKHLEVGTHKENMAFMAQTGSNKGEKHGRAKLTKEQVLEIRASTLSARDIAAKYGIQQDYVYLILKRRTWKHI
jgi:hypothetical protein